MIKFYLLFLLFIAGGALSTLHPMHPADKFRGVATALSGAMLIAMFLYKTASGQFDLRLDPDALRIGKRRYAWADIDRGFSAGTGRQAQTIRFSTAGKPAKLPNFYGIATPALAAMLNGYLPQSRVSESISGWSDNFNSPVPRRKTLSPAAWTCILTVFVIMLTSIRPITLALWMLVAPVSYAAHMLDDYDLTQRAGHDSAYLTVLLARANHGDNQAIFGMGDLYDPTDFLCESTVPKNAAMSISWYQRGVAMDDQGSERDLAIFYHRGIGVPRDDIMAASLFERAAAKNDDIADYELGKMLQSGEGEPANPARALELEKAAAAQGNTDAQTFLKTLIAAN
jgi:TPR repeat protein